MPLGTSVSITAPADGSPGNSAGMPDGGPGHAAASNECPTRAASEAGFSDHSVWLKKRRERHSLSRRRDGQREGNRDHSNHRFSPSDATRLLPVKQERPEAVMNSKVPLRNSTLSRSSAFPTCCCVRPPVTSPAEHPPLVRSGVHEIKYDGYRLMARAVIRSASGC
jgi:ATP-dependent DNA ligase